MRLGLAAATASRADHQLPVQDDLRAGKLRVDRWLWVARFYKTRSQAAVAVARGHVELDGVRAKPAKTVAVGSRLSIRRGELTWEVIVLGLADRRGPAKTAAALYRETPESQAAREHAAAERRLQMVAGPRPSGRPTKRERRSWERLHRR